jgi:NADPH:quinone reductase-like Zn-dependent oxidoreductase
MKAIVCEAYGTPDVLRLEEVPKPTPKDNQVLVKVVAASLNAADVETLVGIGMVRLASRDKPLHRIPGSDVAGRVEAVGKDVTRFRPGDEVFGDLFESGFGAFAEYVTAPERVLLPKPASLSFEDVSTVPQAGILAVQGLRRPRLMGVLFLDEEPVGPGIRVLINGAGGGVGTFAVQIAKELGAEVIGVDSASKLDLLRSLGADHVIDYARQDFAKTGERYDRILDVVARRSMLAVRRALRPRGIYAMVGGSTPVIFQGMLFGAPLSFIGRKKTAILMWQPNQREDLDYLTGLLESGKVKTVIDRRYPLREAADAFRYVASGRHVGKVVITMDGTDT